MNPSAIVTICEFPHSFFSSYAFRAIAISPISILAFNIDFGSRMAARLRCYSFHVCIRVGMQTVQAFELVFIKVSISIFINFIFIG